MSIEDEIKEYIGKNVCVRQSDVIVAKKYISKNLSEDTSVVIESFMKDNGIHIPKTIALDDKTGRASTLDNLAKAISWKNAALEAIWSLIHNNIIYPKSDGLTEADFRLGYSTNGHSAGIQFKNLFIPVPRQIMRSYTSLCIPKQPLTDSDLFLSEIEIPNLTDDIKESLKEAVRCFRYELFTAALAMLGRASEGAWIELGLALANALPPELADKAEKIRQDMDDPFTSVAKKIKIVRELYKKELFETLIKTSGVRPNNLDTTVIWSDNVRDSRNTIHYGATPAMENTYEKIAALLIASVPFIKTIYSIINSTKPATK